jgi:hypothetical protein
MYDVNYEVEIALCNINKDTLQLNHAGGRQKTTFAQCTHMQHKHIQRAAYRIAHVYPSKENANPIPAIKSVQSCSQSLNRFPHCRFHSLLEQQIADQFL